MKSDKFELGKNLPYIFKEIVETIKEWQIGKYESFKIRIYHDTRIAKGEKKILIIPYAERQSKFNLYCGLSFYIAIIPTFLFLLFIISIPLIAFLCLPNLILIFGSYGTMQVMSYKRQISLKRYGYLAIGPSGLIYRCSRRTYGFFTWGSIKEIKKRGSLKLNDHADYIHCVTDPSLPNISKRIHLLRYDNISYDEVISSELLFKLITSYWEFYYENSEKASRKPKSLMISDNILFFIYCFGLFSILFLPIIFFLLL